MHASGEPKTFNLKQTENSINLSQKLLKIRLVTYIFLSYSAIWFNSQNNWTDIQKNFETISADPCRVIVVDTFEGGIWFIEAIGLKDTNYYAIKCKLKAELF